MPYYTNFQINNRIKVSGGNLAEISNKFIYNNLNIDNSVVGRYRLLVPVWQLPNVLVGLQKKKQVLLTKVRSDDQI